jgi:hypothetical protein
VWLRGCAERSSQGVIAALRNNIVVALRFLFHGVPMSHEGWLANNDRFQQLLGRFNVIWSIVDFESSLVLGNLLGLSHEQTHLLTTKMPFNVKANLIRALLRPQKTDKARAIATAINKIQNQSKRNVFAHSYIMSNATSVTFIDRSVDAELVVSAHVFTLPEFETHVANLAVAAKEFGEAHAFTQEQMEAFSAAAHNLVSKSKTSPVPPKSKA